MGCQPKWKISEKSLSLQVFSFKFSKVTKRRRVKRTQDSGKQDSNAELAVKDREVKIGTVKQNAIKHMLNYCTFESYRALQCHLSFFSESSVNESVFSWKHLWPTSTPADGMCPSEAEEYARRAGAVAAAKLVPSRLMCFCSKIVLYFFINIYLFNYLFFYSFIFLLVVIIHIVAFHILFFIPKSSKVKAIGVWWGIITRRSDKIILVVFTRSF